MNYILAFVVILAFFFFFKVTVNLKRERYLDDQSYALLNYGAYDQPVPINFYTGHA